MTSGSNNDEVARKLKRGIVRLHATRDMEIHVEPCDGGGFAWTATLFGDDFLDGPWKATRRGVAKTQYKAFKAAACPPKKTRWNALWRDRDEWEASDV